MTALAPLPHRIDLGIEGLVIDGQRHVLCGVQDLEGQDFLAVKQFEALVGVDHDTDRLAAQGVTRLAAGLHDQALTHEADHQVLGQFAPVVKRAQAGQLLGRSRIREVSVLRVGRGHAEPAVVLGQLLRQEGIGCVQVADTGQAQRLDQAVLQGLEQALHAPLGLGRERLQAFDL